jgi:hypothetical protein
LNGADGITFNTGAYNFSAGTVDDASSNTGYGLTVVDATSHDITMVCTAASGNGSGFKNVAGGASNISITLAGGTDTVAKSRCLLIGAGAGA